MLYHDVPQYIWINMQINDANLAKIMESNIIWLRKLKLCKINVKIQNYEIFPP